MSRNAKPAVISGGQAGTGDTVNNRNYSNFTTAVPQSQQLNYLDSPLTPRQLAWLTRQPTAALLRHRRAMGLAGPINRLTAREASQLINRIFIAQHRGTA